MSAITSAHRRPRSKARALLDDAGTRPWAIWLHFFDVHEHHQIDVPKSLLATVHDGGSPVIHKYRALLHAIDDEVGHSKRSSRSAASPIRRSSCSLSDHGEALGDDPRLLDTHGSGRVSHARARAVRVPHPGRRARPAHRSGLARRSRADAARSDRRADCDAARSTAPTSCPRSSTHPPRCARTNRAIAIHEELQWSRRRVAVSAARPPGGRYRRALRPRRDPLEHSDLANAQPDDRHAAAGALRGVSGGERRSNAERTNLARTASATAAAAMRRDEHERR